MTAKLTAAQIHALTMTADERLYISGVGNHLFDRDGRKSTGYKPVSTATVQLLMRDGLITRETPEGRRPSRFNVVRNRKNWTASRVYLTDAGRNALDA